MKSVVNDSGRMRPWLGSVFKATDTLPMPRKMLIVPRVTMNGCMRSAVTIAPLSNPQSSPMPQEMTTAVGIAFQAGAVNGASFASGAPLSPGMITALFGSGMAGVSENAAIVPLPTKLSGAPPAK